MRILLTGGSGMVGKNILEHPASRHHELLAPSSREMKMPQLFAPNILSAKTIHCPPGEIAPKPALF